MELCGCFAMAVLTMTADRRGTLLVRRTTVPDLIVVPDFNCKEQQFGRTLLRTNIVWANFWHSSLGRRQTLNVSVAVEAGVGCSTPIRSLAAQARTFECPEKRFSETFALTVANCRSQQAIATSSATNFVGNTTALARRVGARNARHPEHQMARS